MTDQHRFQENGSPFFLETSKDYIAINESDSAVFPLAEIRVRNGRTSTHFPSTKMVSESDYCPQVEPHRAKPGLAPRHQQGTP